MCFANYIASFAYKWLNTSLIITRIGWITHLMGYTCITRVWCIYKVYFTYTIYHSRITHGVLVPEDILMMLPQFHVQITKHKLSFLK